jgi:hypothetical protein
MDSRFHDLIEVIRRNFDCEAQWLRSEHVVEEWRGETVWEGDVQIFAIKGHPKAELAYAWSYQTEDGKARSTAILGEGPVGSAGDAVRAAVVMGHEEGDQQPRR